jgi:hypothetical protein
MRRAPCAKHHLSFKVAGVHGLGVDKNGRVRTKLARRAIAPIPKRLRSGVPISMMSAIPRTRGITPKLSALSIAICSNTRRSLAYGGSAPPP